MKKNSIVLMLAGLSQVAFAQVPTLSFEPLAMPIPDSRMVWEPARSGNGHSFEVTPSGYLFQAWFTYKMGSRVFIPCRVSLRAQQAAPRIC